MPVNALQIYFVDLRIYLHGNPLARSAGVFLLAKIGADTAENERNFAEILPKFGNFSKFWHPATMGTRRISGESAKGRRPSRVDATSASATRT